MEAFIVEKKEILSRIESQIAAHQSILSNSKNRSSNESSTSYSSSTSKTSIINNANTINNQSTIQQQQQQQYQQQQNQQTTSQSADQQLVEALEIEINELKRKIMELKTNLSFSQTSQQIQQYQVSLIGGLYTDIKS